MKKYYLTALIFAALATGCAKKDVVVIKESHLTQNLESECNSQLSEFPFTITTSNEDSVIATLAEWHNDYLAYYLQSLIDSNIADTSHPTFDAHFRSTIQNFFTNKGISFVDDEYYWCEARGPLHHDSDPATGYNLLSADGQSIVDDLKETLLAEPSESDFDAYCNSVYASVNTNILDEDERRALKLVIRITQASNSYWANNLSAWEQHFDVQGKINGWGVVWADGEGAIAGIGAGIWGGAATTVAFGILGAGWSSANNILVQVILN